MIGHYGGERIFLDGQTVKTKTITKALEDVYGTNNILRVDTYKSKKFFVKFIFQAQSILRKSQNIMVLPAQNGVRFIAPVLNFWNKFYKRRIHYCVIGGWLPSFLEKKKHLLKCINNFDGIYVETSTMKRALEKLGLLNIIVMPNCKDLRILKEDELVFSYNEPHKVCTFSRVNKQKGIEDAIDAVKRINEANSRIVYQLDIYGQVESNQLEWFEEIQKTFPDYVSYKGCVDFDKSVDVLKNYFALLFPTHYFTEGIPGTILDAYASGLPVVCSKWESFNDLIDDGETGIGYDFVDADGLFSVLSKFADHPEEINNLKKNCIEKAQNYLPAKVIELLKIR